MSYFYYKKVLYYSLKQFSRDYNLAYDSLRYQMRKYRSKEDFYKYLNQNPDVIDVMIQRYSKNRGE